MAVRIYNLAGAPDVSGLPDHGLSDVPPWAEDAVRYTVAQGVAVGYSDGTFRPTNPISRGEFTIWMHRLLGLPAGAPAHTFSDVPAWLDDAVSWMTDPANDPPFATGFAGGVYRPGDEVTRGQATRMLYRIFTALTSGAGVTAETLLADIPRTARSGAVTAQTMAGPPVDTGAAGTSATPPTTAPAPEPVVTIPAPPDTVLDTVLDPAG